jgi:hypothetical protein
LKEARPHFHVYFAVVIVALATASCVLLIPLCAWVVFSVHLNSLPEWQQDKFMLEAIPGMGLDLPLWSDRAFISFLSIL